MYTVYKNTKMPTKNPQLNKETSFENPYHTTTAAP